MSAQQSSHSGLSLEGVRAIYGIPKEIHDSAYSKMSLKTREIAKPKRISDTHRVSRMKKKYRRYRDELLPLEECICAISRHCPLKPSEEHDCRSLAPTWKAGHYKGWQLPGYHLSLHRYIFLADLFQSRLIDTDISKDFDKLVHTATYFGKLAHDLQSSAADLPLIHQWLRKWLSDMRCLSTNRIILAESNILEVISDFSRWIIRNSITYRRVPEDVRGDLEWLKKKWRKGDWNLSNPLRGIHVATNSIRSLNKDWDFYNPDWNRFGHNDLISGETWQYRIVMMRDGGHGSSEAGISGIAGEGATSVVLSSPKTRDEYADWDLGYKIGYVSTSGAKDSPTSSTQFLLDSHEWYLSRNINIEGEEHEESGQKEETDGRPVRVFRSWKLPPKNMWRPKNGFRYDGLYNVTDKELIDEDRALYRFTMERRPNQGKIRVDQPDDQTMLLWFQCDAVQKAAKYSDDLDWRS